MDGNTQIIIVVVLALLALAGMILYRQKGSVNFKIFGIEMGFKGENPAPKQADAPAPAHNAQAGDAAQPAESRIRLDARAGISIEDAKAGEDILLDASDGGGVTAKGLEAGGGILAASSKHDDSPKA